MIVKFIIVTLIIKIQHKKNNINDNDIFNETTRKNNNKNLENRNKRDITDNVKEDGDNNQYNKKKSFHL